MDVGQASTSPTAVWQAEPDRPALLSREQRMALWHESSQRILDYQDAPNRKVQNAHRIGADFNQIIDQELNGLFEAAPLDQFCRTRFDVTEETAQKYGRLNRYIPEAWAQEADSTVKLTACYEVVDEGPVPVQWVLRLLWDAVLAGNRAAAIGLARVSVQAELTRCAVAGEGPNKAVLQGLIAEAIRLANERPEAAELLLGIATRIGRLQKDLNGLRQELTNRRLGENLAAAAAGAIGATAFFHVSLQELLRVFVPEVLVGPGAAVVPAAAAAASGAGGGAAGGGAAAPGGSGAARPRPAGPGRRIFDPRRNRRSHTRNPEAKPTAPKVTLAPEPTLKSEPQPEPTLKSEPQPEPTLKSEPQPEPTLKSEPQPDLIPDPTPEPDPIPEPDPEPELTAGPLRDPIPAPPPDPIPAPPPDPIPAPPPAPDPADIGDELHAFIRDFAKALRERVPPEWHTFIETCLFRTLLDSKDRLTPDNLDHFWQLCHYKNDPGLDPDRWAILRQGLLHPEHRVRVAHALPLHLSAGLPGSVQHLHLVPLTCSSEEILGWLCAAMEQFPCVEPAAMPPLDPDEPEGDPTLCALARMAIAAIEGASQLVDRLPDYNNKIFFDMPMGQPSPAPQHDAVNDVTSLAQTAESLSTAMGIDLNGLLRLLMEKK